MQPWDDDGAEFDLSARTAASLVGAAVVGLVLGLAGWVSIIAALVAGQDPPVAGLVVLASVCTPLLVFAALCLVNITRLHRTGDDTLVVEAAGLRRTSRIRGFAVAWPELERVDVVASEGVTGDRRFGAEVGARRRAGTLTVLRLVPADPARFAVDHPTLSTAVGPALARRTIASPFGLAFAMTERPRTELVAALARYAGPRFGGFVDETTGARRRSS